MTTPVGRMCPNPRSKHSLTTRQIVRRGIGTAKNACSSTSSIGNISDPDRKLAGSTLLPLLDPRKRYLFWRSWGHFAAKGRTRRNVSNI